MKKIFTKTFLAGTLICFIAMLEGVIFYNRLPDEVATHFTFSGVPNGYSPKNFAVFFLPLILMAINFFIAFSLEYSPKEKFKSKLCKALYSWLCPVLAVIVQTSIILFAMGINLTVLSLVIITVYIAVLVFSTLQPKKEDK